MRRAQLTGEEAVLAAIEQLEGFEAPAAEWERSLLPARVPNYDPRWLDNLCLAGIVGWGRISPHPAWQKVAGDAALSRRWRRVASFQLQPRRSLSSCVSRLSGCTRRFRQSASMR